MADKLKEEFQNNSNEEGEFIFENSYANKKPKPIINYSLLMKFFKIEEIFEIIKLIILEEPILFFSDNFVQVAQQQLDIYIQTDKLNLIILQLYKLNIQYYH